MNYTIAITDPRLVAGLNKQLAAYNAGQIEGEELSIERFLAAMLPLQEWADQHAPAAIPTGEWLQRWTDPERSAAFSLGAQNAEVQALWMKLLAAPVVHPDNADLVAGVPLVCAALEQLGVIAPGQAATRAAAITAY